MTGCPLAAGAAILLIGAASPSYARPAPPASIVTYLSAKDALSAADLVALTEAAGADLTPLNGKPFRAVVVPGQTSAEGPRWWYDDTHQALSLHASIGQLSGQFFRLPGCAAELATARGIEISRTQVDPAMPGGAGKIEEHRVSLGGLACGHLAAPSGLNVDVSESRRRANVQLTSLRVTIEGTLQLADGHSVVTCGGERIASTSAARTELVIHQCVIGAAIRDMVFTADGIELARWDAAKDRVGRRGPPYAIRFPSLQDLH
jgi:hypothetical protein